MMTFNQTSVSKIFNNNSFLNLFDSLAFRWLDEGKYEDINDYAAPIERKLNEICKTSEFSGSLKMSKRPFGFTVVAPYTFKNGITIPNANIVFKCTASGSMSWKVVA